MLRIWAVLGWVPVLAAGFPGMPFSHGLEKGDWEISGMGAWSYSEDAGPGPNTVTTQLALAPALVAYPSRYLFLGPILEYNRVRAEKESDGGIAGYESLSTRWDLGLQTGILVNWSNARFRPLPYLGATAGLSVVSLDVNEDGTFAEDSHLADNGHFFAFFLGGKLRLSESFYFNLQPTLTFVSIGGNDALGFRVGTGFSGTF